MSDKSLTETALRERVKAVVAEVTDAALKAETDVLKSQLEKVAADLNALPDNDALEQKLAAMRDELQSVAVTREDPRIDSDILKMYPKYIDDEEYQKTLAGVPGAVGDDWMNRTNRGDNLRFIEPVAYAHDRQKAIQAQGVPGSAVISVGAYGPAFNGDPWAGRARQVFPASGRITNSGVTVSAFTESATALTAVPTPDDTAIGGGDHVLAYAYVYHISPTSAVDDVADYMAIVDRQLNRRWLQHRGSKTLSVISAATTTEVKTGVAATLGNANATVGQLADMVAAVSNYLETGSGASFVLSTAVWSQLRAADVSGLAFDPTTGLPFLFGYPITLFPGLPATAANAKVAYFGVWDEALIQAERPGIMVTTTLNTPIPSNWNTTAEGRFIAVLEQAGAVAHLAVKS